MRPSDFLAAETPLAQHTGKTLQASIAFALRKRWRLFGAGWAPVNTLASRACEATPGRGKAIDANAIVAPRALILGPKPFGPTQHTPHR